MSGTFYNFALLFNEEDLIEKTGFDLETTEDLWEAASHCARTRVNFGEHPWVEVLAACSERLNTSRELHVDYRRYWLENLGDWQSSVKNVVGTATALPNADVQKLLEPEVSKNPTELLKLLIKSKTEESQFLLASRLAGVADGYLETGVLGFLGEVNLNAGGPDYAIDMRSAKEAIGQRVIVEIAVVWE